MSTTSSSAGRPGRETRLLLVTIAISVGVLLLLARFRFPDEPAGRPVESAPAPLERLAAQATYDELATIMSDLERRITPRVWVLRTGTGGAAGGLVVAPRLTPDRAVLLLNTGDRVESVTDGGDAEIVAQDLGRGIAVVRVPAVDDGAVPIRTGAPRPGPRYVAVVEATPQGPALRPVYVGRMQLVPDPRTGAEQLQLAALQHALNAGTAVFTLDGAFLGLVRDGGSVATVITSEFLRAAADGAQPYTGQPRASLGVDVEPLSPALTGATGADRGVIVTNVAPGGPAADALQSGDVIQVVDGTAVATVAALRQLEASRVPGANVTITGVRRGSPIQVTVTASDAAAPPAPAAGDLGVVTRHVPGAGIEVVTVGERSPAARAGLQAGDLILAINGEAEPGAATLSRQYRSAKTGEWLLLTVQRSQRHHVLALEKR